MKRIAIPFLVIGIAGAMLAASPVEASDKASAAAKSSQRSCVCRKVTIAALSKTSAPATNPAERESTINSDFAAQHPSGGG